MPLLGTLSRAFQSVSKHQLQHRSMSSTTTAAAAKRGSVLVSAAEAHDLINNRSAVPLDATWHMPNVPRNAFQEYKEKHLPGARFWDHDAIAEKHPLGLPHMLPSPETFASACSERGISNDSSVVIYDSYGCFSGPRALWTFQAYGHRDIYLINGGLPRWIAEGYPVETGEPNVTPAKYIVPSLQGRPMRSYEDVINNQTADKRELVLDARSGERYAGTAPEPRPGLSSGHMPHSLSLPFNTLLTSSETEPKYQMLLPQDQLRSVVEKAVGGADQLQAILKGEVTAVGSCGSGMTAAVIMLALRELGAPSLGLYDESWTGYAQRAESPIVKS